MSGVTTGSDTDKIIYHQDWLFKKESFNTWAAYWVVLRGRWMLMYDSGNTQSTGHLRKTIELSPNANCSLVARRKRRFPFSLVNAGETYYFKSGAELQRYHWIVSLLLACTGKPKKVLPTSVPASMQEQSVFPSWDERHAYKFSGNKSKRPNSAPAANKRREKYNERKENRYRVKAENKLICENLYEQKECSDQRRQRRKSSRDRSSGNVLRPDAANFDYDDYPAQRSKSMLDVRANLGFQSDEFDEIVPQNPQVKERRIYVGEPSKSTIDIPVVNIIDLEDDETSICNVSLHGDEVLPNMIIEEKDLINLTTPRHSRSPTPVGLSTSTDNRFHSTTTNFPQTPKGQITNKAKAATSVDRGAKNPPRPTSPYLATRSIGLGNAGVHNLFAATGDHSKNTALSPRFSRHTSQSEA